MTQHWVNPVNATSDAWGYELSPRELMRKIKPNVSHTWHAPTKKLQVDDLVWIRNCAGPAEGTSSAHVQSAEMSARRKEQNDVAGAWGPQMLGNRWSMRAGCSAQITATDLRPTAARRARTSGVFTGCLPMIGRGTCPSVRVRTLAEGRLAPPLGGRGQDQASGDRRRPAIPAPLVPCCESSRWVVDGLTAVEFT